MKNIESTPFWIEKEKEINKNLLNIILIAHVQQPRGYINNSQIQCSKTERFSVEEFYEIYSGIISAGYFVQSVYYNELDFISDFVKNPINFQNCLIYNLARNGLGDNKKTIIPSFCELVGLKYSTSSSLSCALCRNKYYFTTLFNAHNIEVPKSWLLSKNGEWVNGSPANGQLVICKPCSESASQGINKNSIFNASPDKFNKYFGTECIIQEYIDGIECEVPIFKIDNTIHVFPPVGIDLGKNKILDEDSSDCDDYGFYQLDNILSTETLNKINHNAKRAFKIMQMMAYGRIDFRINKQGTPYIFDVSTTPYTTKHSSFAFIFDQLGYEYSDIYRAIITSALSR